MTYIEPERRRKRSRWQKFKDYLKDLWEMQFPDKKNYANPTRKKRKTGFQSALSNMIEDAFSSSELDKQIKKKKIRKPVIIRFKEMLQDSLGTTELKVQRKKRKFSFRQWIINQIEFYTQSNEFDNQIKNKQPSLKQQLGDFWESIRTLRFRLELWKFDLVPMINSAMMMVFTYLIVFFFNSFFTALVATHYNLKPIIYLYRIKYLNYYDEGIWNLWSVTRSYSAGPIFCFFSGAFVFLLFQITGNLPRIIRQFMLWYSCMALVTFFSKVIFIPVTSVSNLGTWEGLGIVASWFYVGTFQKIMLAFLAAFILFLTGFVYTKAFLKLAYSRNDVSSSENRGRTMNQLAIGPLLIGTAVIFIIHRDLSIVQNTFTLLSALFMFVVSYFNAHANEGVNLDGSTEKPRVYYELIVLLLILIPTWLLIMQYGIDISTYHFM